MEILRRIWPIAKELYDLIVNKWPTEDAAEIEEKKKKEEEEKKKAEMQRTWKELESRRERRERRGSDGPQFTMRFSTITCSCCPHN
ncbi:hypothetical protein GLAREA_09597 [Glarea lozoyensis ATCC 20868]|uniref:Uncharacterized protein n=1 Tax=Glarea lozoyensis (strain ATCC 20868 / MF5171) TaxID=1116229 RepID=S3D8Z7_GLAL2|nr:uncharacterized protein GLAREA_09597 [Glarea lozoyensis ATCC 20868]EPE28476.1 hypothetical protein GLAREA_09597 [Glarea lozoyensis ATCC 20868]